MKKFHCDACGQVAACLPGNLVLGWSVFSVPCHVAEKIRGYIDRDGNEVSGRQVNFDLCPACSNKVYGVAFLEIDRLRGHEARSENR